MRRIAHEFGIPLAKIKGTGAKGRVLKEDVQKYVKERLGAAEKKWWLRIFTSTGH